MGFAPGVYFRCRGLNKVAEILGKKVKVTKFPIGYFDIYKDEHFENGIAAQLEFVKRLV